MTTLRYDDVPLHEVVVRLTPCEPLDISITALVNLFELLKDKFKTIEEAHQVEPAPGRSEGLQLRVVRGAVAATYSGHAKGLALTVFPHVVSFGWRLSIGGPDYPHFEVLEADLWWALDRLRQVFKGTAFDVVNMSYGSFVETGDTSAEGFMGRYFVRDAWPARLADSEQFHDLNMSWRDGDVDMRFVVARGEAQFGPETMAGYRLLTVAGKQMDADPEPVAKLQALHEGLKTLFLAVITKTAKEEWKHVAG